MTSETWGRPCYLSQLTSTSDVKRSSVNTYPLLLAPPPVNKHRNSQTARIFSITRSSSLGFQPLCRFKWERVKTWLCLFVCLFSLQRRVCPFPRGDLDGVEVKGVLCEPPQLSLRGGSRVNIALANSRVLWARATSLFALYHRDKEGKLKKNK